jgi:hypothetical protein
MDDKLSDMLGVAESAVSGPTGLYSQLMARYRPGYKAAKSLAVVGFLLILAGIVLTIWGIAWFDAGYAWKEAAAPVLFVGGFGTLVAGFVLRATASILRAILDRTCFSVPGLSDEERVRLAYEAGGEAPPK